MLPGDGWQHWAQRQQKRSSWQAGAQAAIEGRCLGRLGPCRQSLWPSSCRGSCVYLRAHGACHLRFPTHTTLMSMCLLLYVAHFDCKCTPSTLLLLFCFPCLCLQGASGAHAAEEQGARNGVGTYGARAGSCFCCL